MPVLKRIFAIVDSISVWSGKLVSFCVLPMSAILILEVFLRYVFNHPTIWVHGLSQRLFVAYCMLGGAYVHVDYGHIYIDLLHRKLSLRSQAVLRIIVSPFFFTFCAVLFWYGLKFGITSLRMLEVDETPWRAPIYPVKLLIPLGALLMLLQGLGNFGRDLIMIFKGENNEH